jgi:Xaa-Pro aminopeptidase
MRLIRLPVLRRGMTVWDRDRLPLEEIKRRFAAAQESMKSKGLYALVIYGDLDKPGHVTYLTNFVVFEPRQPALLLLPATGEMQLMIKTSSRDILWIKDYTFPNVVSSSDLAASLEAYVKGNLSTNGRRIGFVGARLIMPYYLYDGIKKIFTGSQVENCDDLLFELRRRKSSVERAIMNEGLQKLERQLRQVLKELTTDTMQNNFMARLEYRLRLEGCQDVDILIKGSGSTLLKEGDLVSCYVAVQYLGYWTEKSLSFVMGRSSDEYRKSYQNAYESLQQTLEKVKPGVWAKGLAPGLEFGKYGWGQGMGTDREEAPFFSKGDEELREGDVLSLRVSVSPNKTGDIFLTQMVTVAKAGYQMLGEPAPPELLVV